jgi:N6-L-threonylcarbamoyladenine synthase
MKILAIESSCDETAASVVEIKRGVFGVLSNVISSQEKVHAQFGGIIPEVAARLHVEKMLPILEMAVKDAKETWEKIDYIAVCSGPGLVSSLMVGVETAKTLAYALNKPLVNVNHIEGHLLSSEDMKVGKLKLPAIGLIVSGGHTQIILVKDYLNYRLIGETRDDAAGEAFDKVAKIMNLGYPGGPAVSKVAALAKDDNRFGIKLPRPMLKKGFDMSFSGLKTAVLYLWQDLEKKLSTKDLEVAKSYVAKEFQQAVVDVLAYKTIKAVEKYNAQTVLVGGGVSANRELRSQLERSVKENLNNVVVSFPDISLTGDNATMIAMAAYYHIKEKRFVEPFNLRANPNWQLV